MEHNERFRCAALYGRVMSAQEAALLIEDGSTEIQ